MDRQSDIALINSAPNGALERFLLRGSIEEFYFHEAMLQDDRRFEEWLELLSDDLEYWVPVRSTRSRDDMHLEFTKKGEAAFFDDDKRLIESRVRKLSTGFSWAEDPPSRTRHLISNVMVLDHLADGELRVASSFHIYRSRLAEDEDWFFGKRIDQLRPHREGWLITKRHVFLDHVSIRVKNISVFF